MYLKFKICIFSIFITVNSQPGSRANAKHIYQSHGKKTELLSACSTKLIAEPTPKLALYLCI